MISSNGYAGTQTPSIRFADYQEWTTDTAALFTQIAFYRPTAKSVHLPRRPAARLAIAQASDNLLQLLNVPARARGPIRRGTWTVAAHSHPQRVAQDLRRRSLPRRPDRRH